MCNLTTINLEKHFFLVKELKKTNVRMFLVEWCLEIRQLGH